MLQNLGVAYLKFPLKVPLLSAAELDATFWHLLSGKFAALSFWGQSCLS